MIETSTIIEAVYYFLNKTGEATKLKLLKLLYLADKYHLIRYGRTVTDDDYYAMEHGPVGSTVKDVLEFNRFTLAENEYAYASKLFDRIDDKTLKAKPGIQSGELEMLSESDIEALDFIIKKFGKMTAAELRNYTHRYPEWKQYREFFENNQTKRERLKTEELLSILPGDPLGVTPEHIEESREILTGHHE
ncbi:MAG: Panacea domain-containing protein [Nitrospinota bacterium]